MEIDETEAAATREVDGTTYYFCSQACVEQFDADPAKFIVKASPVTATDPVCGMEVEPASAAAKRDFGGQTYYFCSEGCARQFDADPAAYLPRQPEGAAPSPVVGSATTGVNPQMAGPLRVEVPIADLDCATCTLTVERTLGSLDGVVVAIELSRATMRNIKQNLFGSFIYNSLGVPIAAGVLHPFFGILLSPIIASAAMALSSVTVVGNALRLRGFKPSVTAK
jgi:YHS domain-containing protein